MSQAISLTKNSKIKKPDIIIDTSTFFSALYNPKGNEALLLHLADNDVCFIHILDYVIKELVEVCKRKMINHHLINDLLDTYQNIIIEELSNITPDEIAIAKKLIRDPFDRPIFIFALQKIQNNEHFYLVSGDKGFFTQEVQKKLNYHIYHTKEMIKVLRSEVT